MNPTAVRRPTFPWPGPDFDRNRALVPATECVKYAGQHVAWNWDGAHIVAGAESLPALLAELRRRNIDPAAVVFDFVDNLSR